jgi:hypothetical protein
MSTECAPGKKVGGPTPAVQVPAFGGATSFSTACWNNSLTCHTLVLPFSRKPKLCLGITRGRRATSLLFLRKAVLGQRHPGSVRASFGGLSPEDRSRERRLRAGLSPLRSGGHGIPRRTLRSGHDAFRGGRGSPRPKKRRGGAPRGERCFLPFRGAARNAPQGAFGGLPRNGLASREGERKTVRHATAPAVLGAPLSHACVRHGPRSVRTIRGCRRSGRGCVRVTACTCGAGADHVRGIRFRGM